MRGGLINPGFPAIKSLQQTTVTCLDNAASGTVTITAVDTANSILIPAGFSWGNASAHSGLAPSQIDAYLEFTNSTTITAKKSGAFGAGAVGITYAITVLEFHPGFIKSIQRGIITFGVADLTKDAVITAVDTTKAFVLGLGFDGGAGSAAGDNINVVFPRLSLQSSTAVRATRIAQNGVTQPIISYQVVELYQ